jgi:hypothetical protein
MSIVMMVYCNIGSGAFLQISFFNLNNCFQLWLFTNHRRCISSDSVVESFEIWGSCRGFQIGRAPCINWVMLENYSTIFNTTDAFQDVFRLEIEASSLWDSWQQYRRHRSRDSCVTFVLVGQWYSPVA